MKLANKSFPRILIVGNSGSGKTYLAKQLGELLEMNIIHFDEYFWESGGLNIKRPIDIVRDEILEFSKQDHWIMEGVFGDLAAIASANAILLIFLDKSWQECESALKSRGFEPSKHSDQVVAENNFKELLKWAKEYWSRENSCSQKRHDKLFSEFEGDKLKLLNRHDSELFLNKHKTMMGLIP